ncbi:MAG TPA: DNA recombination protein RmuC [Pseudolabrys sp.]|nr:DNA recombination protein RmuC [Pseudolabrys sp.]
MSDTLLPILGLIIALGVAVIIVLLLRPRRPTADPAAEQRLQELNARLDAMGSWLQNSHAQLQQTVNTRLDAVTQNLGESMKTSTKNTTDHLKQLHERLAVIDSAQKNITDLASTVTSLQKVFDNKQRRGAFGQGRMEAIVADGLPQGAYEFQFTLSNNSRPDCCIHMPDNRHLTIDAKFPLEATTALENAKNDDERLQATRQLRQNLGKHIDDISGKYLIAGETQDVAFMFIPSESMFAELYDAFDDVLQKGYRAGVIIVSPSLLMLAIQVVQQIQKDARMRAAADKILTEVGLLIEDVQRMRDRVENLDKHFGQASADIKQIVISADKILSRGEKIQDVEFSDDAPSADIIPAPMTRKLEAGE